MFYNIERKRKEVEGGGCKGKKRRMVKKDLINHQAAPAIPAGRSIIKVVEIRRTSSINHG